MAKSDKEAKNNSYMRYSGMAFELVALLLVAVFLGGKLDNWLELEKSYMTMTFLIIFLVAYFFRIYYAFSK